MRISDWSSDVCSSDLFPDLEAGVEPLSLMGFMDPPREEAVAALAECRSAGVMVKMITGDHAATALAIARQIDLADDPQVVTGPELERLSDKELQSLVRRVRSEEHTSELQSLMRISYAVFCLKKKKKQ